MIGELVALAAIIILPAGLLLAILTVISLGVAGLAAADLDEGRLLRGRA
jgi:hypothetical protein